MAPKRSASALPKALAVLKEVVQDDDGNVNPEALGKLDPKQRSTAFSVLGTTLKRMGAQYHDPYKALVSDEERRQHLANFLMCPENGTCSGYNETSRSEKKRKLSQGEWITEEELSGPLYLNSKVNAALAVNDLTQRPHELPSLAKKGVKQYEFFKNKVINEIGTESKVGIKVESDLTGEEYAEVKSCLDSDKPSAAPPPKKTTRKPTPTKPAKDLETVKLEGESTENIRVAKAKLNKVQSQLKTLHARMSKELDQVVHVEERLKAKSWGDGPVEYLRKSTVCQRQLADQVLQKWASCRGVDCATATTEAISAAADDAEGYLKTSEETYSKYD
jgi:hypothetical protein